MASYRTAVKPYNDLSSDNLGRLSKLLDTLTGYSYSCCEVNDVDFIFNMREEPDMPVVKIIELVGESPNNWEEAMREVVTEAQKTLHGITRIRVKEFDVRLQDDKIHLFRVRAEVSFRLER